MLLLAHLLASLRQPFGNVDERSPIVAQRDQQLLGRVAKRKQAIAKRQLQNVTSRGAAQISRTRVEKRQETAHGGSADGEGQQVAPAQRR